MSIVKSYSVFCDGEISPGHPCPSWSGEITDDSHPRPAMEARRLAKQSGWTRQRKAGRLVDLCSGQHAESSGDGAA